MAESRRIHAFKLDDAPRPRTDDGRMKFQVGQLVKPRYRRHRFGGGTLAMVKTEPKEAWCGMKPQHGAWFLWLNGDNAGEKVHEPVDMFKGINE